MNQMWISKKNVRHLGSKKEDWSGRLRFWYIEYLQSIRYQGVRTPPLLLAHNEQSWGKCPRLSEKLKYIFKSSLSLSFSYFPLKCFIAQFSEVHVKKGQKYRLCYLLRRKKVATILFWPQKKKIRRRQPQGTSYWNKTCFSQSSGADV